MWNKNQRNKERAEQFIELKYIYEISSLLTSIPLVIADVSIRIKNNLVSKMWLNDFLSVISIIFLFKQSARKTVHI